MLIAQRAAWALLFASSVAMPSAATAALISYTANQTNSSAAGAPGGRCGASLLVSIGDSSGEAAGTSTFGAYEPETSHCVTPPLPAALFDGVFSFAYANGSELFGTYEGFISATGTPGVFSPTQTWTITGGRGLFAGATGTLQSTGTVTFAADRSSIGNIDFTGSINVVPEPAGIALFGIAALGLGLARRRPALAGRDRRAHHDETNSSR